MLCSQEELDLFRYNKYVGSLPEDSLDVGTGVVGSEVRGDLIRFQVRIKCNKIIDVKYKILGTDVGMAVGCHAANLIVGSTIEEALKITDKQISSELGLSTLEFNYSCLVGDAMRAALKDYRTKTNKPKGDESQNCCMGGHFTRRCERTVSGALDKAQDCSSNKKGVMYVCADVIGNKNSTTVDGRNEINRIDCIQPQIRVTDAAAKYLKEGGLQIAIVRQVGCGRVCQVMPIVEPHESFRYVVSNDIRVFVDPVIVGVEEIIVDYEMQDGWEGVVLRGLNIDCACGVRGICGVS